MRTRQDDDPLSDPPGGMNRRAPNGDWVPWGAGDDERMGVSRPSKSCLACRSARTRPFGVTGSGQLRECMVCGAVYSGAGIILRPSPAARAARIQARLNIEQLQINDRATMRRTVTRIVGGMLAVAILAVLFAAWLST